MRYFKKPTTSEVHGYDDTSANDAPYIEAAIANGWLEVTERWPPAPTATETHALFVASAQAALTKSDVTMIRCVENGVAVPAAWATYRADLRAIVNGTDMTSTSLPAQPAYPAGT